MLMIVAFFWKLKGLGGNLSQDISTLSAYLQTWRLKLSHTKTVTTAFHLNNREAKRELKVYNNDRLLLFCSTPTYHGVKLDRSLYLVAFRKKLSSRVTLLRRLVSSRWSASLCTLIKMHSIPSLQSRLSTLMEIMECISALVPKHNA